VGEALGKAPHEWGLKQKGKEWWGKQT